MNFSNVEIIHKIKQLFKRDAFNSYASIAFDWTPQTGTPETINLYIATASISESKVSWISDRFSIRFPDNLISLHDMGASETIGLMPRTSYYYDENKSAFFERDLADLLLSVIDKLLQQGEKCIVLQGPFFPKLIGRLGYRYFSEEITFAAITFDPLRFTQSSASVIPETEGKISFKLGNGEDLKISENKLSDGLAEVQKTWTISKVKSDSKEIYYMLDVFCQFPYGDDQRLIWESKIVNIENAFFLPGLISFEGNKVWLPFGLALAWEECRGEGQKTDPKDLRVLRGFLPQFEMDVPEMRTSGKYDASEIVYLRSLLGMSDYDHKIQNDIREIMRQAVEKEEEYSYKASRMDDQALAEAFRQIGVIERWKPIQNLSTSRKR